jgi:phosphoribosylanthranilate isomerase
MHGFVRTHDGSPDPSSKSYGKSFFGFMTSESKRSIQSEKAKIIIAKFRGGFQWKRVVKATFVLSDDII